MSDDLVPRLQMLAALLGDPRPRATVRDAIAEIERLRAEVEALRADAERYRWLRGISEPDEIYIAVDSVNYRNRWALMGEQADAAIDAARSKP